MKTKNYICLNGQKIDLGEEKLSEIKKALDIKERFYIETNDKGEEIAHIGEYDFLVLDRRDDTVALILKSLYKEKIVFGGNNDFRCSKVLNICQEVGDKIAAIVGRENIVRHRVDLTSDDGLRDYGHAELYCSILTVDLYRRYVDILDFDRLDKCWWLATPYSTPRHDDYDWVKSVSSSGNIATYDCKVVGLGLRPFLILKSDIFESSLT